MYNNLHTLNFFVYGSHFPSFFRRFVSTWRADLLVVGRGGDAATTPFDCILFVIICIAKFRQKSNVGSGFSSLARARACPAFTSATDNKKVNCPFGHHFVFHVYSNPIGSCQRLFTLSTQCFPLLCRLKGSAYLNVFHSPFTHRQVE